MSNLQTGAVGVPKAGANVRSSISKPARKAAAPKVVRLKSDTAKSVKSTVGRPRKANYPSEFASFEQFKSSVRQRVIAAQELLAGIDVDLLPETTGSLYPATERLEDIRAEVSFLRASLSVKAWK